MHRNLVEDRKENDQILALAGRITDMEECHAELVKLWDEFLLKMPGAYDYPLDYGFLLGWHGASVNAISLFKELCIELPSHREDFIMHMAAVAGMDEFILNRLEELSEVP